MWNALAISSLSLLLLGCANAASPEPQIVLTDKPQTTTNPPSSEEPQAPPPPPDTVSVVTIPTCTDLVPQQTVLDALGPYYEFVDEDQQLQSFLTKVMGPAALEAFSNASSVQPCAWGIDHSDGFNTIRVAILPEETRDKFVTALEQSDFIETPITNGTSFVYHYERMIGPSYVWYGIHENLVVASLAALPDGSLGEPVLNAILNANPQTN